MNFESHAVARVTDILIETQNARKATYYVSPTFVIKASRVGKFHKRDSRTQLVVTFGKPNYAEREFIKLARKAKEPFPIYKLQLKFWPKKKPH